ncbi:TIGR04211 family SH3 domain-containing protein [Sessilibacter sp. MAH2]
MFVNKTIYSCILSLLITTAFCHSVSAETVYITDVLYIPMRSGKGNEYRIIESRLKSGTALEVLETDNGDGWTKIRTPNNQEGYVRTQYLSREKTAKLQLDKLEQELNRQKSENARLEKSLKDVSQAQDQLNTALNASHDSNRSTLSELEEIKRVSANALELNKRHQDLLNQHQMLQTQIDILKAENARLKSDDKQTWFMYGAAAVLLGVIISVLVPVVKRPKNRSGWKEY